MASLWKDGIRIGERAYRRGFLVGVTLAEICILLVFVLLLLAAGERQKRDEIDAEVLGLKAKLEELHDGAAELVAADEAKRLRSRDRVVQELERASGLDLDSDEYFDVLVRELRKRAAEFERYRDQLKEKLEDLEIANAEAVSRQIFNQARQIQNLEAQKAELLGRGLVYPSCIPSSDGRTTFAYNLKLAEEGISGSATVEALSFGVANDLAVPDLEGAKHYQREEFIGRTSSLYRWSVQRDCRFVVRIVDATGASSKVRYKELLEAVEVNFYKLLAQEAIRGD